MSRLRRFAVPRRGRRGGFTLIELLVVVAIIGILIALVMPALSKARNQAKRSVCLSQMHQVAIALGVYQSDHEGQYPTGIRSLNWPMGSCMTQAKQGPDNWVPAGPALLYKHDYINQSKFFYCPFVLARRDTVFTHKVLEQYWDLGNWNSQTGAGYPIVGYGYWARFGEDELYEHSSAHDHFDKARVAQNDLSRPETVVWTDIVMKAHGRGVNPWLSSSHMEKIDWDSGKAQGGHELFHHGGASWTPLSQMRVRWKYNWGMHSWIDEIYFSGLMLPGDELLDPP